MRSNADLTQLRTSLTVISNEGAPVGSGFSADTARLRNGETVDLRVQLPQPRLAPGHYHCDVSIGTGTPLTGLKEYDVVAKAIQFEVLAARSTSGTISQWQHNWGKTVYSGVTSEPIPPGAG